jgi:hypothetical protein
VILATVGVASLIAALVVVEVGRSSNDDNLVAVATTVPLVPFTYHPTPTIAAANDPLSGAVWPLPDSATRYTDPVEAARAFAVDFVGFTDPVIGTFEANDSRSGSINVRSTADGPDTIIFLRKLADDDSWWVVGSASANIVVEDPDVRDVVSSPLTMNGKARAFEGTVNVALRVDGVDAPLFEGVVTGGSGPDFGPFEGTFEFDEPGEGGGALMSVIHSAKDGSVAEATVTRVFFAGP